MTRYSPRHQSSPVITSDGVMAVFGTIIIITALIISITTYITGVASL